MESSTPLSDVLKPPHEPLSGNEVVMRRFLNNHFKSKRTPPLQDGAFFPRPVDITGLSVSRRASDTYPHFLNEQQLKSAPGDQRIAATCGVCAFMSDFAKQIGLEIHPDPDVSDKGHSLLPQIIPQIVYDEEKSEEATLRQVVVRKMIYELTIEAGKMILIQPSK